MKKIIIIVALVIGLLLGFGFYFYKQNYYFNKSSFIEEVNKVNEFFAKASFKLNYTNGINQKKCYETQDESGHEIYNIVKKYYVTSYKDENDFAYQNNTFYLCIPDDCKTTSLKFKAPAVFDRKLNIGDNVYGYIHIDNTWKFVYSGLECGENE